MSDRSQILNSAANAPDLVRRLMQGLHAVRDFVLTLQPQQYPRSLERIQIHRKPPRRCRARTTARPCINGCAAPVWDLDPMLALLDFRSAEDLHRPGWSSWNLEVPGVTLLGRA